MIIVRVELWSAVTRRVTELARMRIANTGESTRANRFNYDGCTFRGRDTKALDRETVSRTGNVKDYPRQQQHVWNLIARMLAAMGYGERVDPQSGAPASPAADATEKLIDAAIALAWSEIGTAAKLNNEPDADWMFDPWPAMDRLCDALDALRPSWREQDPTPSVRTCRECGCTDDRACEGGCHWVGADLCSACVDRAQKMPNAANAGAVGDG